MGFPFRIDIANFGFVFNISGSRKYRHYTKQVQYNFSAQIYLDRYNYFNDHCIVQFFWIFLWLFCAIFYYKQCKTLLYRNMLFAISFQKWQVYTSIIFLLARFLFCHLFIYFFVFLIFATPFSNGSIHKRIIRLITVIQMRFKGNIYVQRFASDSDMANSKRYLGVFIRSSSSIIDFVQMNPSDICPSIISWEKQIPCAPSKEMFNRLPLFVLYFFLSFFFLIRNLFNQLAGWVKKNVYMRPSVQPSSTSWSKWR